MCLCQSRGGIWSAEALLRPAAPPASVSVAAADVSPWLRLVNSCSPAESCVWRHVLPGEQHASVGSTGYYRAQSKEYEREGCQWHKWNFLSTESTSKSEHCKNQNGTVCWLIAALLCSEVTSALVCKSGCHNQCLVPLWTEAIFLPVFFSHLLLQGSRVYQILCLRRALQRPSQQCTSQVCKCRCAPSTVHPSLVSLFHHTASPERQPLSYPLQTLKCISSNFPPPWQQS